MATGVNLGRLYRDENILTTLEAIGKERTALARGEGQDKAITSWTPKNKQEAEQAGITDRDVLGAIDYYRTPRGEHPNSCNKLYFTSFGLLASFDAFHLAEKLLTQPLLCVVGELPGAFGAYRDAFEIYDKAASKEKKVHVVKGADHYDVYDNPKTIKEAMEQFVPFYKKHLCC